MADEISYAMIGCLIGFIVGFWVGGSCLDRDYRRTIPESTCNMLGGEFIGKGWISCNEGFTVDGDAADICVINGEPHRMDWNIVSWIPKHQICGEAGGGIPNNGRPTYDWTDDWTYCEGETDKGE